MKHDLNAKTQRPSAASRNQIRGLNVNRPNERRKAKGWGSKILEQPMARDQFMRGPAALRTFGIVRGMMVRGMEEVFQKIFP
jgi:hypothetical protein